MGDASDDKNFICFSAEGEHPELALDYQHPLQFRGKQFNSALHALYYCFAQTPAVEELVLTSDDGAWPTFTMIDFYHAPDKTEEGDQEAQDIADALEKVLQEKFRDPAMCAALMRSGTAVLVCLSTNSLFGVNRAPKSVRFSLNQTTERFKFNRGVSGENLIGEMLMATREYFRRQVEFSQERAFCFKRINADAQPPSRKSDLAAGFDLACVDDVEVPAHGTAQVQLGFKASVPENFFVRISSRSGLFFKHGIEAFHGTIDADYRGEWIVGLKNHSGKAHTIKKGERVAQALVLPYATLEVHHLEDWADLSSTERGEGGFGSTGEK